ncbi:MAG: hypothetical protein WCG10_05835 [Chlamydiota bacterium]
MRYIFFSVLLIIFQSITYLSADSLNWNTAQAIPPGASSGVRIAITISPGPNAGDVIAAWADSAYSPYYSIYNNGTWTTGAISLGASGGAYNNIYTTIVPNSSNVMAAWKNYGSDTPYYSIYNGSSWATATITLNGSAGAFYDVTLAAGPNSGEVAAAWTDSTSKAPYYSIYSNGTWTTNTISLGTSNGVANNVFISEGPSPGTLIATWSNLVNGFPYYSIYQGGNWSTGTIPDGGSTVYTDVCVTQGSNSGEMVATWADSNSGAPYYSIYQGGIWTTGSVALGGPPNSGIANSVYATRGPSAGELVMTWNNYQDNQPYYSLYSNGSWSDGAVIPLNESSSTGVNNGDVCVGLLLDGYTVIAAWGDVTLPYLPYFTSVVGQPPVPPTPPTPSGSVNPPTNGQGRHVFNQFANYGEYFNALQWTLSTTSDVVYYRVYRSGTLIATLGSNATTYEDRNQKNIPITYTVTAVDASDNESSALIIQL